MKNNVLENKVKKGMELLDKARPNWESFIDLEELDLEIDENCILGQLFGSYNMMETICGYRTCVKGGFQLRLKHDKNKNWNKLNSIWANKIKERQCNNGVNGVATV